jgi:hypothetical protein
VDGSSSDEGTNTGTLCMLKYLFASDERHSSLLLPVLCHIHSIGLTISNNLDGNWGRDTWKLKIMQKFMILMYPEEDHIFEGGRMSGTGTQFIFFSGRMHQHNLNPI